MTTGFANTHFIRNRRRGPPRANGGVPPAPAGTVAEVIREKGPTRVHSRGRRPPYPVPSNRSAPSAPATDTAPRPKRRKAPAPAQERFHQVSDTLFQPGTVQDLGQTKGD
ncbi:unnamed protein product [Pleuronectes platessa]|uniref:Uncharacterized protein n=1 Tax=Pleuronectes platessa TaxID=8262 RepID=A0A9N7YD14_PLEPL|nr:unnamed protein product [Pleuronectes platessa]